MRKYGTLMSKLQSNYAMAHDNYPKILLTATDQLSAHRHDNHGEKKKKQNVQKPSNDKDKDKSSGAFDFPLL